MSNKWEKITVIRCVTGSIVLATGLFAAAPLAASTPVRDAAPSVEGADRPSPEVAVQAPALGGVRDELAMVVVGSALIGLAAAVRRAS